MSLLGIDLGSSNIKGVVFDHQGSRLSEASSSYHVERIWENGAECDADEIWQSTERVIRELAKNPLSGEIEALAISSHGETFIPVDSKGDPAGNAIMNSDNRASEELAQLLKLFGKKQLYSITGVPAHTMFAVFKIMWLKHNRPEVFVRADKFLSVGDFVLSKLGAGFYTDYSLADRTMCLDIRKRIWSEKLTQAAGLKNNQLPEIVASGSPLGNIPAPIANSLGLKDKVLLAMGGHDQPCGAFGAGAYDDRQANISAGTYECLSVVTNEPMNTRQAYAYCLNSYPHVVEGKYINLAFFPAGFATNWIFDEFCFEDKIIAKETGKSFYQYINEKIESVPPSDNYFLPYLVGTGTPYWDAQAKGALLGITPGTSRYQVIKSIYEGIAYELKLNLGNMEKIIKEIKDITISGGNSRFDFSIQLRSDIIGKRITRLDTSEAVCKGAAMLAGIALGVYSGYEDAVKKTCGNGKEFIPNPVMNDVYQKKFLEYKKIYHSIKPIKF